MANIKKDFIYQGVAGKASIWQSQSEASASAAQAPQSAPPEPAGDPSAKLQWDGTCYRQKVAGKHDDSYGRPPPGSKSDIRGKKAGNLITSEVSEVCMNVMRLGYRYPDGTYCVEFGPLFEVYTRISNKLVGMLLRARRQGLVQFEGEMLFQRQDDHVIIRLVKVPKAAEEAYCQLAGGPVPEHMLVES